MKKVYYLSFLLLATGFTARGQGVGPSVLNSAGGDGTAGGNSFSWSMGEMALVSTVSNSNLVITQGVLQPSEQPTGIRQNSLPVDALHVFPNPTSDLLYIQPSLNGAAKLEYTLMDITGRVIFNQSTDLPGGNEKQTINLSALANGHYALHVNVHLQQQDYQAVYKIEKLQ
ncbi:T9SS type A sorting domain-containing protein [Taibaiella soli]|nr:T9SS type A sorting domain-containing protein [Taibaiella soli]